MATQCWPVLWAPFSCTIISFTSPLGGLRGTWGLTWPWVLPLHCFPANPSHLGGHQLASLSSRNFFNSAFFFFLFHTFSPSAGQKDSISRWTPNHLLSSLDVTTFDGLSSGATATASTLACNSKPQQATPLCWRSPAHSPRPQPQKCKFPQGLTLP